MPLQLSGTSGVLDNSGAFIAGTAVASTSGTSIDFTSIPSWVKRVTVIFQGVSASGASIINVQLGTSSGIVTSSYIGASGGFISGASAVGVYSLGFALESDNGATRVYNGNMVINKLSGNTWAEFHAFGVSAGDGGARVCNGGGHQSLSGTLDRVRITTANGTDTFDAGTINILYE